MDGLAERGLLLASSQLAAAGGDVDAPALAHGAGHPGGEQPLLEAPHVVGSRRSPVVAPGGVQGDDVHLDLQPGQEGRQAVGVSDAVIGAFDQGPFDEDLLPGPRAVGPAGGHQVGQGPAPAGGDEGVAFVVGKPLFPVAVVFRPSPCGIYFP